MVNDMSAVEYKGGFSEKEVATGSSCVLPLRTCGWGWGSIDSESRLDVEAEAKNALDKDSLRARLAEAGALQVLTDLLSRTNDVDVVEHVAASLRHFASDSSTIAQLVAEPRAAPLLVGVVYKWSRQQQQEESQQQEATAGIARPLLPSLGTRCPMPERLMPTQR